MMRPLVSYDDITAPQPPPPAHAGLQNPSTDGPPSKKRKTNKRYANGAGRQRQVQHWDDPGNQAAQMSYDTVPSGSAAGGEPEDGEEEEEESRELTQDEVWDDSALVDAWDSAMAEYRAFHGPGDKWKEEPVKKSPLWYNVPHEGQSKKDAAPAAASAVPGASDARPQASGDSVPLNFDTFVPTHDPTLVPPHPPAASNPDYAAWLTAPSGPMVSQDEAFSRALSAMYWGGYWTAVYHCQRNMAASTGADDEEGEIHGEEQDGDGDDDMLPAQR